ncbi:MAG: phage holin family protein, partial [Verrucomicrobia bacterium]|nr:phage holin family protein [Verrucomicrobiota bacterium]
LLTLPIFLLTLGLFTLFINALLLYFTGYLLRPHFYVEDYWSAFKGALIISVVSLALNTLTGTGNSRVQVRHVGSGKKNPQIGRKDDGNGPVIDV